MSYHMDKEVNSAVVQLLDALCQFERDSGRRSTLLLIPHNPDEDTLIAQDGKPLTHGVMHKTKDIKLIFELALRDRGEW